MIRLFDENDKYTDVASSYDMKIMNALRPVFDQAKKEGGAIRDLMTVANGSVTDVGLMILIGWDEPQNTEKKG